MTSEKNFQSYVLKQVPHGYRTALTTGGGFPDCLLIHGDRHSLVELKILDIGPSGNKKLSGLFKKTQPPWYWGYLSKGGTRLYVVFRIGGHHDAYGLLHVNHDFLRRLSDLKYLDLGRPHYREYSNLKELISDNFA